MIVLTHGKYISGFKIFRVGEILPETPGAKNLVEKGLAKIVADVPKKSAKNVKKSEPEKIEPTQDEPTQENAQVNT